MRRIYLLVLAVVLVATLVGLAISEQAGYVLIAYKSFRYESSLWSFLALLAVVWLLVVLVRLVLRLLGSSGRVVNPGRATTAGVACRWPSTAACAISAKATGRRHCVTCGGRRRWASGR